LLRAGVNKISSKRTRQKERCSNLFNSRHFLEHQTGNMQPPLLEVKGEKKKNQNFFPLRITLSKLQTPKCFEKIHRVF